MDNALTQTPVTAKESAHAELDRRLSDRAALRGLIKQAAREAVLDHKRNGVSISSWEDGRLVIIQPEDIVVPED